MCVAVYIDEQALAMVAGDADAGLLDPGVVLPPGTLGPGVALSGLVELSVRVELLPVEVTRDQVRASTGQLDPDALQEGLIDYSFDAGVRVTDRALVEGLQALDDTVDAPAFCEE